MVPILCAKRRTKDGAPEVSLTLDTQSLVNTSFENAFESDYFCGAGVVVVVVEEEDVSGCGLVVVVVLVFSFSTFLW